MLIQFFMGTILGSFIAMAAYRLPLQQSICTPRSACTACQTKLSWLELVPLFSALFQKFRCRHCHAQISIRYFLIEFSVGSLFIVLNIHSSFDSPSYYLWLTSAILLASIDAKTYFVCVKTLLFSTVTLWTYWWLENALNWQLALGLGILIFCCWSWLQRYIGNGDCLILISWSAGLNINMLIRLLFIASFIGLVFGWGYSLFYKKMPEKLPFVPFLAIGLFVTLATQGYDPSA